MLTIVDMLSRTENEWYAIRTKSRYEKAVASSFRTKGYDVLLPLYRDQRSWCGRNCQVELPLFSGYVFARFDRHRRLPILQTPGVVQIVGTHEGSLPIDEEDILHIRRIVETGVAARPWPFLSEGMMVEIVRGPLTGVRGIFVRFKNEQRLVVSLNLLQRSISVEAAFDSVRPIPARFDHATRRSSLGNVTVA